MTDRQTDGQTFAIVESLLRLEKYSQSKTIKSISYGSEGTESRLLMVKDFLYDHKFSEGKN